MITLQVAACLAGVEALADNAGAGKVAQPPHVAASGAPWQEKTDTDSYRPFRERLEKLGLTPEQRTALRATAERYRPRFWDLAQRGAQVRRQLAAVPPDDPGYADAVRLAADAGGRIAADAIRLASEMWSEVYVVLTAEQRQKLREDSTAEQERWDEWRRRHRSPEQPAP